MRSVTIVPALLLEDGSHNNYFNRKSNKHFYIATVLTYVISAFCRGKPKRIYFPNKFRFNQKFRNSDELFHAKNLEDIIISIELTISFFKILLEFFHAKNQRNASLPPICRPRLVNKVH